MNVAMPSGTRIAISTLLMAALLAAGATSASDRKANLLGRWQIDDDLTAAAQPVNGHRKSRFDGLGMPSISVNGIPLPNTGSATPTAGGSTPDPKVLRCSEMTIETVGKDLLLTYLGVGSETLTPGRVQGIATRWKETSLTSNYETTSRRVSRSFELQKDGTLLVTVKLKPSSGPSVTHKRVFRRTGDQGNDPTVDPVSSQ